MERSASVSATAFTQALARVLETAHTILPEQGPIESFIHHNTLHHWEEESFHTAIQSAAKLLKAKAYLSLGRYQQELNSRRITAVALSAAIDDWWGQQELAQPWLKTWSVRGQELVRQALMVERFTFSAAELDWIVDEELTSPEVQCYRALAPFASMVMQKDEPSILHCAYHELDTICHEWLVTISSAVLDRGVAFWSLPQHERDILGACMRFTKERFPKIVAQKQLAPLVANQDPVALLEQLVRLVGEDARDTETFLLRELLALPGWAGQFSHDLERYLCARIWLKIILRKAYGDRHIQASWLRQTPQANQAKMIEWAQIIARWQMPVSQKLLQVKSEIMLWHFLLERLTTTVKQRILHNAYEESYFSRSLNVLREAQKTPTEPKKSRSFTAIFCIDDREESMRRHLEQEVPDVETHGFAGFFGVDVQFQSHAGAPLLNLCPPVLSPTHLVAEESAPRTVGRSFQVFMMRLERWIHEGSRREVYLMPLISVLGVIFFPLIYLRLQLPRLATMLATKIVGVWNRPEPKKLRYRSDVKHHHPADPDKAFTVPAMVAKTMGMIRILRLHDNPPPLIFVIGHGATTVNNPHASAYNCGACGGHRGATNARLYAQMANDPDVRKGLADAGYHIPETTWFVAGCHDTSADVIDLFDIELVPAALQPQVEQVRIKFRAALAKNALERSRRFMSARVSTPAEALAHVETRAIDLREPRVECGHATNALAIVGTRALTQKTFYDRRAFLISYDVDHDVDAGILKGLLQAVVPVCAGISLEYFFSTMDPAKYGCGTKLPHNVAAMIGVMDGGSGDLRTGLPTQMTEIHEPMRLLFIVEADEGTLRRAMAQLPQMQTLLKGEWMHLALYDRKTGALTRYVNDVFVPVPERLEDVVRIKDGLRYSQTSHDHLNPAVVE